MPYANPIHTPVKRLGGQLAILNIESAALQENSVTGSERLCRGRGQDSGIRRAVLEGERLRSGDGRVVAIVDQNSHQRRVGSAAMQNTQIIDSEGVDRIGRAGQVEGQGVPACAIIVAVLDSEEQLILGIGIAGCPLNGKGIADLNTGSGLLHRDHRLIHTRLHAVHHFAIGQQLQRGDLPGRRRKEIAEECRVAVGTVIIHFQQDQCAVEEDVACGVEQTQRVSDRRAPSWRAVFWLLKASRVAGGRVCVGKIMASDSSPRFSSMSTRPVTKTLSPRGGAGFVTGGVAGSSKTFVRARQV